MLINIKLYFYLNLTPDLFDAMMMIFAEKNPLK